MSVLLAGHARWFIDPDPLTASPSFTVRWSAVATTVVVTASVVASRLWARPTPRAHGPRIDTTAG